jgi:NADH:ubiquinone oxidoreductase subunit 6 (subunit J)
MQSEITFWVLAAIAVVSAVLMVSRRKASRAAMFFGVTLLATAGIFVQLRAWLLFGSELVLAICIAVGLIGLAVELGKLNVATVAEYRQRAKFAGLFTAGAVVLEAIGLFVQRRWFPGQSLAALLPEGPLGQPPTLAAMAKFFFSFELLPLALLCTAVVIVVVGFGALFQKRV